MWVLLGLESDETLHNVVRKRRTEPKQQATIADHMKKQEKQLLENMWESSSSQALPEGLRHYGPGYSFPSPHLLSGSILEKEFLNIHELKKLHENEWKRLGAH